VNIGDSQKGQIKSKNVIDVGYAPKEIQKGIKQALSPGFKKCLKNMKNPYDKKQDGKISTRIVQAIKRFSFDPDVLKKKFADF